MSTCIYITAPIVNPLLKPYVECIWMMRAPSTPPDKVEPLPADGRCEITFMLAGKAKRQSRKEQSTQYQTRSFLLGGRSSAYRVAQEGPTHYLSVRLRPGGLAAFLPLSAYELTDCMIDLHQLWGNEISFLEEQLAEARSFGQCVELLNAWLIQRCAVSSSLKRTLAALHLIEESRGQISLPQLAEQMDISIKQVERIFQRTIGFMPKTYLRIVRFQHTLSTMLTTSETLPLVQLAYEAGYSDQAHMSKDFRALAGAPPRAFMKMEHLIVDGYTTDPR
ncbi:AraC family transcriptional regulator [Ktedonosporobacter rubrisoli]|uniref:AraC family transcriptional regulator n=1 Tax=Ktedonosporobacter rubrisoli TaxID=2509675 RepID=A0A4P6JNZ6_KTERU|nr:AraC family transcriptional regulator [Ktedonosporobacter rubrisoli]QBD76466.1 AraC family transcriptional regulator [Ktedonosporobacter rubrisoli]